MARHAAHPPTPPRPTRAVVAALVQAGVSEETATAMDRWKADEVLELLRPGHSFPPGDAVDRDVHRASI